MRIANIHIRNFRSIQELTLDIPRVCALVGANSAGKSNVLDAVQRVLARDWVRVTAFAEEDVYGHTGGDIAITVSFAEPIEYERVAGYPASIAALSFLYTKYKIGQQKGERRLEQRCLTSTGDTVSVLARRPKKGESHQYEQLVTVPPQVRDAIPLIYLGTNRSISDHLPGSRFSLLRQLLDDVDRDLHQPTQVISVTRPDGTTVEVFKTTHFKELMDQVLSLLRTDQFNSLERSIKKHALRNLGFDPDVDIDHLDLTFQPFNTIDFYRSLALAVREGDFRVSATELGGGVQNALVLGILQAFEERRKQGAILLIEEPEMFLHPQTQRALYKTLRTIGETNQVIYTTHSPHFVSIPEYDEVRLIRKTASGTTACASTMPATAQLREKLRKELDPERNELFFASRVLFVEGATEKLALPEYANRLSIDLDRAGATIVEVGGKRNLLALAQLAISFAIPTGVLYDRDSSDIKDKNQEAELNAKLNALATEDEDVRVWCLTRNYEEHLKKAIGPNEYEALCQQYPHTPKPTRARLIAANTSTPVPEPVEAVLRWLSGQ